MDPARARLIPSIEQLRQRPRARILEAAFGAEAVLQALRAEAAALRAELAGPARDPNAGPKAGPDAEPDAEPGATPDADQEGNRDAAVAAVARSGLGSGRSPVRGDATRPLDSVEAAAERLLDRAEAHLTRLVASRLRSTINATGVIVHTNLGRAPLAAAALQRVVDIGAGYASLEYDLAEGRRGRRDVHAEALLCHLTTAAAAIVVNNNAAAVLLLLSALANGREVIISRGELVEIGGGFRVPDVMRQSGAVLREVGTTNKTRAADYAAAISDRTALILRVHPSNFVIEGFTARPALDELTAIGRQFHVPVAEDLGSGYVAPPPPNRLPAREEREQSPWRLDEPTVQASVRAGADVVTFSGDKLFGGPQAGLIVGRRDLVDTMRHHPLMRALRVDKLTYAALDATLVEHVRGRAATTVPVMRMLTMTREEIDARAQALARALSSDTGDAIQTAIVDGQSAVGGGSAPGARLPTRLLAVAVPGLSPDTLLARLRAHDPPIIARIDDDRVVIDLRTVLPEQDATVCTALRAISRGQDNDLHAL